MSFNTCFLHKAHPGFPAIGTSDIISGLHLGAILNREIAQKKGHKNIKTMTLNNHEKNTCLQYKSWNKKAKGSLVQGNLHFGKLKFFAALSVHIHKWC